MKKNILTKYFNKQTFGGAGTAPTSLIGVTGVCLLVASGSIPALGFAMVGGIFTAGYVNKWQEVATGKPLWKPRTPFYGL